MRIFFIAAACALIASYFGWHYAENLPETIVLIPNFLRITLHHNAGIAFGIMLGENIQSLVIHLAIAVVIILAVKSDRDLWRDAGFGLILGGALSNLIDRAPDGLVTDYFAVGTFPIFNIPDACITIGVALLLLEGLRKGGLKE